MKDKEGKMKNRKKQALVETEKSCQDRDCPFHGKLKTRGRIFKGTVIKKFPRRIVIEFERMIYVRKYERFTKAKTKLHARISKCFEDQIKVGDYVKIKECRPLSKIIHFVLIEKIKDSEEIRENKK